jgi:membrane protein implicated in regulation of membrane protease activity
MINFVEIHFIIIWLAATAIFTGIELFSKKRIFFWFAGSSFVTAIISLTSLSIGWQITLFLVISFLFFIFVRPAVLKRQKEIHINKYQANPAIGKELELIKSITSSEKGEIRDDDGKTWTAVSDDGTDIPAGTTCLVTTEDNGLLHVIAIRNKKD